MVRCGCGHDNPDGSKFCLKCGWSGIAAQPGPVKATHAAQVTPVVPPGTQVIQHCDRCRERLPDGFQFCQKCGKVQSPEFGFYFGLFIRQIGAVFLASTLTLWVLTGDGNVFAAIERRFRIQSQVQSPKNEEPTAEPDPPSNERPTWEREPQFKNIPSDRYAGPRCPTCNVQLLPRMWGEEGQITGRCSNGHVSHSKNGVWVAGHPAKRPPSPRELRRGTRERVSPPSVGASVPGEGTPMPCGHLFVGFDVTAGGGPPTGKCAFGHSYKIENGRWAAPREAPPD